MGNVVMRIIMRDMEIARPTGNQVYSHKKRKSPHQKSPHQISPHQILSHHLIITLSHHHIPTSVFIFQNIYVNDRVG